VSPSQTAAKVDTFMIAVLPHSGQRHRIASAETAAPQSQLVSAWCIRGTLLLGYDVGRTKPDRTCVNNTFALRRSAAAYLSDRSIASGCHATNNISPRTFDGDVLWNISRKLAF
jgi:hypothetical protein